MCAGRLRNESPLDAVVTIVIPHYNMVPLLLECLESVALQTVPAWEAIVVDDASTHGNVKESISQVNDPRIHLLPCAEPRTRGGSKYWHKSRSQSVGTSA